jgi:hypothetical protein
LYLGHTLLLFLILFVFLISRAALEARVSKIKNRNRVRSVA